MTKIRLVCLIVGQKKDGTNWYKASFKKHDSNGNPQTAEFFLPRELGEKAVREGLREDIDVLVELDFDDFFRPTISSITKAKVVSATTTGVQ